MTSTVRDDVHEDGLVGVLVRPATTEPLPAVLLLGGAEGGLHERHAALLARHGFAVLALAYYGLPGLPPTLKDIPLEYFATAIDYLRRHPAVDAERIGISGGSKGGEAALLVAATFPGIRTKGGQAVTGNVRNGSRPKTGLTESSGEVGIDVPRDRAIGRH